MSSILSPFQVDLVPSAYVFSSTQVLVVLTGMSLYPRTSDYRMLGLFPGPCLEFDRTEG